MGLFSFIKKAAGKVLKTGLSVATRGVSDKVLKAFKGSAGSKSPQQQEALLAKVTPPTPRTSSTESRVEGWGFAGYGNGKRERAAGKRKPAYTRSGIPRGYGTWDDQDLLNTLAVRDGRLATPEDKRIYAELKRRGIAPPLVRSFLLASRPRKAGKRSRMPSTPRSGGKRRPPTGGLDLKALSASWKAAGKPGTWQGWIAANK